MQLGSLGRISSLFGRAPLTAVLWILKTRPGQWKSLETALKGRFGNDFFRYRIATNVRRLYLWTRVALARVPVPWAQRFVSNAHRAVCAFLFCFFRVAQDMATARGRYPRFPSSLAWDHYCARAMEMLDMNAYWLGALHDGQVPALYLLATGAATGRFAIRQGFRTETAEPLAFSFTLDELKRGVVADVVRYYVVHGHHNLPGILSKRDVTLDSVLGQSPTRASWRGLDVEFGCLQQGVELPSAPRAQLSHRSLAPTILPPSLALYLSARYRRIALDSITAKSSLL